MNRLWVRLTLSFIVITQISIVIVALSALSSVNFELQRYMVRQSITVPATQDDLVGFFQRNGDWKGIEKFFANLILDGKVKIPESRLPIVADADGKIVFDASSKRLGTTLSSEERNIAIVVNNSDEKTIGFLLPPAPFPGKLPFHPAELEFLNRLRNNLMLASVVIGVMAIVLALVLTRTLVAPLASLASAARAFANHKWDQRVKVRGANEIAAVATAFNEMADELQRAEILRRNMIADIAHELRTPLTVMQGNLRAVLDEVYPLEMGEIVTLYEETRLISRLVDDLRELALADAGRLGLDIKPIDLSEVVRTTVSNFSIAAENENLKIDVQGCDSLPLIRGDADRVAQVLRNLLINALRYTQGHIIVSASVKEQGEVILSVADTGKGIAPEDLPHIFDRFYRGDKSRSRASGGTGLGLAIARAWVEAMNGKIGVESTPGMGSRFWFALPVAA
jgi:two-component system OmpR family sensor kinase/two-component system sensor histidine kinase BaeS